MTVIKSDNGSYYANSTCRVVISTHNRTHSVEAQPKIDDKRVYFSGTGDEQEIITCAITKMPDQPCGTFAFEIVPKTQDWLKVLRPNDWVDIFMDNGRDGKEEKVMTGLVDTIRRRRQVVDQKSGATMTTINVAGRDCGKPLVEIDPFLDPKLSLDIEGLPFMNYTPSQVSDINAFTANEMVERILNVYLSPPASSKISKQFFHPQGNRPFYQNPAVNQNCTLRTEMTSDKTFKVILSALPNLSQNMWALMEQYANRLLNAFYIEMLPFKGGGNQPTLYMHQHPFAYNDFFHMDVCEINRDETQSDDLGLSSHEVKNFFRVDSSIFNTNKPTNIAAIIRLGYISLDSIYKHGLKRADYENMYSQITQANSSTLASLEKMTDLIASWNWNNENLLNGQIVCRLRPDVRLNKRIDLVDQDETLAFINEGYVHNWVYQGNSTTNINVSRGVNRSQADSNLKSIDTLKQSKRLRKLTEFVPTGDPATALANLNKKLGV